MKNKLVNRTLIGFGLLVSLSCVLKDTSAAVMYRPKPVISSKKKAPVGKQMVSPRSFDEPMLTPLNSPGGVSTLVGQNQGFTFPPAVDSANSPFTSSEGALNTNLFNLWTGYDYFGFNGQRNTGLDYFRNLQRPRSSYDSFNRVNNWLIGQQTSVDHKTTSPSGKTRNPVSGRH
jgi:hypothetical protein